MALVTWLYQQETRLKQPMRVQPNRVQPNRVQLMIAQLTRVQLTRVQLYGVLHTYNKNVSLMQPTNSM